MAAPAALLLALVTAIAPPVDLRVSSVDATSGTVTLRFSWKMDCPQDVCLMAQSFQAVRNGQVVATADAGNVPATSQQLVSYTITLSAAEWKPGDCFQVRAAAGSASGFTYSDLSNKVCLPSGQ
jgi:hypothetical protein